MSIDSVQAVTTARTGRLDWAADGKYWPHAESSRFVQASGLRWHVQQMGQGPVALLIHGTGASTHSWRLLAPLLARQYMVIAPDLPGHGFTQAAPRRRLALPGMAASVAELVETLEVQPTLVIGHSAGAAILIRCCLDELLAPRAVVSINGALLPFRGPASYLFPPLAKLMFLNPLTPRVFARGALDRARVMRLIRGTGSELDKTGIDLYARLFSSPEHVAATLGMMAHWNLQRLMHDLPELELPLLLITAANDKAIAPADAERICQRVVHARQVRLPGLGHLAHEEDVEAVAGLIHDFMDKPE